MKITKDISKLDNIRGANAYLIETDTGLILVDAGMSGSANNILSTIKEFKKPLELIVLTHADIDHVGGAATIKRETGAKVAIGIKDAPVLTGKKRGKKVKGPLNLVFKVLAPFVKFEYITPDQILKDGDSVGSFKILDTPGHTDGSISLYRASDGVVISGDALLGDKQGNLKEPREAIAANYDTAKKSAEKIKSLKPKLILPGHGQPVKL